MKPRNPFSCLLLSLTLCGLTFGLSAQENPPATNNLAGRKPNPGGRLADGFGPAMNVLTEEQRASVIQVMQTQRDRLRELESKLRNARRDLFATGLNGKFDEEAVRKQALAVANLEADLSVLRVKALSQVQPPLSPEQVERIKTALAVTPGAAVRPLAPNPGRQRILQNTTRDENGLPPKQ